MADQGLPSSIRGVLRRLKVKEIKHLADAELLERYVSHRDEAAFTALVGRHGPTVLNVCRRVLRGHDVDDVFQATFLALAKEASHVRRREALGAWLYEVAYHAALRAKNRSVRNHQIEQAAATADTSSNADEVVYRDMQQVLDEELHLLPERLRKPLVMVHLLGQVQVEAARELGITDRALRKRLRIGRERLRHGLTRRGVTLTAAAFAVALDQAASAGPVAPGLLGPTVDSVLAYAAGQTAAVPAATVSLAMVGVGGWLAGRFKLVALVAIPVLATLALTAAALVPSRPTAARPDEPMAAYAEPDLPPLVSIPRAGGKTAVVNGRVLDANGRPIPGAAVTALARRPWQADDRGLHDGVVARAVADAEGRYSLVVPADFPTWSVDRRVTLLAHAAGSAPVTDDIPLDRPTHVDLRLPGAAAAVGRLLGPDGRPAAAVTLAVVRLGTAVLDDAATEMPSGWPATVKSGLNGEFRVDGVRSGENLWLQVRDDRFALTTFRATAGGGSAEVTLTAPRLLTGRITAADTGRPLAEARVSALVGPDQSTVDYFTALAASPTISATAPPAEVETRTDADGRYNLRLPPGVTYRVYVYPPAGSIYLGWRWATLSWTEGEKARDLSAPLPTGIAVRGRVVEDDGQPVVGATVLWMHDLSKTEARPEVGAGAFTEALVNSEVARLTGVDGRFRLVVPAKSIVLRVFGPTADYRLDTYDYERCSECGKDHLRPGENARVQIDLTAPSPAAAGDEVRVVLHRGQTVTGRAVGPDNTPIRDGVLVCRTIAQPLRKPAPRSLPIREGVFELPGCVPDRIYPVLLLAPANDLAAVAEVRLGQPTPTVQLTKCGTAAVRLTDAAGRPIAGKRSTTLFWLPDDRAAAPQITAKGPWSNVLDASWIDPQHFLPGPVTGADGIVTVSSVVPGLQYQLKFGDRNGKPVISVPFRVEPGHSGRLPDVVVPDEPPPEHPIDEPPAGSGVR
jgi:RNA polymerase sigma factor (sigma-70 family)